MSRLITSDQFIEALIAAGVLQADEKIRRVVIDLQTRHAITIYVERLGDDRLLSVVPTLEGVEIKGVPA